MPVPSPRWLIFSGVGKETTWNTPVATATYYPIEQPKHRPRFEKYLDQGFRGNAAAHQAFYQGVGWSEINWPNMWFYPDDSGIFLMGLLGTDVVTGTIAPFTHTITLLNSAFPPSYTGARFTNLAATAEQIGGIYWEELTFKFANPGRLTVDAIGRGTIQGTVTKPTPAYSAQQGLLPWQGSVTVAGSANAKLLNGTISLKRPVALLFGMSNAQNANGSNVDVLAVTGKLEFYSTDMTELNYWLNNTQPSVSIVFTSGANSLTLQMSKCAFDDPTELDFGTPYARTQASFVAIANATDGGTGNAPIRGVLLNPRSTSY